MLLVRTAGNFPFDRLAAGSVATIGAYDGLHLGHRKLLDAVLHTADSERLTSVVMSFEPTPREFFSPGRPPVRLMRFREKFEALAEAGIDIFFCPKFNDQMRGMSAATFIRQILIHVMNVRHLVVGDDFRFASGGEGTVDHLRRAGKALGYSVTQLPSVLVDGERASSTAIRAALCGGDFTRAERLLGRPWCISGRVVGRGPRGRLSGLPTVMVNPGRRHTPVVGTFAARVRGLHDRPLDAVALVGPPPAIGGTRPSLELHIVDFDGDIVGAYIHVDFVSRMGGEQGLSAAEEAGRMHRDAVLAKEILAIKFGGGT